MKILIVTAMLCVIAGAQTADWLNPYPTGAELRTVKYLSNGTIHAAGEGTTFLTSKDSGQNWIKKIVDTKNNARINSLFFGHPDSGWICTASGDVYRTVDGGTSFTLVRRFPGKDLGDIAVLNSSTVIICADSGMVFRSTDAGGTWTEIQTPTIQWLYSMTFINDETGYICGDKATIIKTASAGAKWNLVSLPGITDNLRCIKSKNDTVVASGVSGLLLVSSDTGNTYSKIPPPEAGGFYNSIVFAGNKTIYTGTNFGKAYRSTNFGSGWTILPSKTGPTNWLFGCDASSPSSAVFVGRAGTAMVKRPEKDSLLQTPNFTSETFRAAQQVGSSIFATGLGGIFYRSTDNGQNWSALSVPSGVQTMSCMKFTSPTTGVIAGATGKINYTTNGGTSWSGYTLGTSRFWGIDIKGYLGLAVNTVGNVYRSMNGGSSWSQSSGLGNVYLYSVSIADSVTAFLCTGQQQYNVYKTTDAGISWNPVFTARANLFGISFVSPMKGAVVGDAGQLYVTYDGGSSWIDQRQDTLIDFRAVAWSGSTIVAAGLNGVIVRSTDEGDTFTLMNSPTGSTLFAVDISTSGNAVSSILLAGESGNMFRYNLLAADVRAGGEEPVPYSPALEQNYPNPFNPSTTIRYSIPGQLPSFRNAATVNVSLKIYDVMGREVSVLVDEQQPSGNYSVRFNAASLSSGIYFYRLSAGEFVAAKRMLLLK